jgi:hypothetical protein
VSDAVAARFSARGAVSLAQPRYCQSGEAEDDGTAELEELETDAAAAATDDAELEKRSAAANVDVGTTNLEELATEEELAVEDAALDEGSAADGDEALDGEATAAFAEALDEASEVADTLDELEA